MQKSDHCVCCGKRIEYSTSAGGEPLPNHHCSRRHEAAVEAANHRRDEPEPRARSFAERLEEGFGMLGSHFELLAPDDEPYPAAM